MIFVSIVESGFVLTYHLRLYGIGKARLSIVNDFDNYKKEIIQRRQNGTNESNHGHFCLLSSSTEVYTRNDFL